MAATITSNGGYGLISSLTTQATTGATAIDFSGIPAGVRRVTVMVAGISTNGVSDPIIQIGAGSVTTTGYNGYYFLTTTYRGTISSGIYLNSPTAATSVISGITTICLMGSNLWSFASVMTDSGNALGSTQCSGYITLGGTLDRVRLTTMGGTNTFDAGSVNVLYE